jgi:hypothetical protein
MKIACVAGLMGGSDGVMDLRMLFAPRATINAYPPLASVVRAKG